MNKKANKSNTKCRTNGKRNNTKQIKDLIPSERTGRDEKAIINNPEWRKFNEVLSTQVMSFPFTSIAGAASNFSSVPKGIAYGHFNPAGIMRIDINPSIGYSDSDTSAANQAARYLYTKLSANNMKTTQYGPQDVLMALLSLGEVVSISTYCRRALGLLGTVNPRNWYYPKAIISAMGINYDDFVKNASIYRTRYNYIAAIASAIAFPADINYFNSCRALFNDVFLDHSTGLAQTYMFVPSTYWDLNEKAEGGSALETKEFVPPIVTVGAGPQQANFSTYLDKLESVINNLMTSATLQYLYADVLKYVGNNGGALLSIETVSDDYAVLPVYSEEVLGWIENAIIMGQPEDTAHGGSTIKNNVTTDAGTNAITYRPVFKRTVLPTTAGLEDYQRTRVDVTVFSNPVLNFHVDDPSVNDRIIATRFVPGDVNVIDLGVDGALGITAILPDHYIVSAAILGMNPVGDNRFDVMTIIGSNDDAQTYESDLFLFHRRPRIIIGAVQKKANGSFDMHFKNIASELDNYTVVDTGVMGRIQSVSNLALFRF